MRVALLLFLQLLPAPTAVRTPARDVGPVTYEHEHREDPSLHLHVVTIDLTDPAVSLVVRASGEDPDGDGPWHTTLARPSAVAAREGLDVAVNGDFFATREARQVGGRKVPYLVGNWARVSGYATTDGRAWAKPEKGFRPVLAISGERAVKVAARATDIPPDAKQLVSGSQVIVSWDPLESTCRHASLSIL